MKRFFLLFFIIVLSKNANANENLSMDGYPFAYYNECIRVATLPLIPGDDYSAAIIWQNMCNSLGKASDFSIRMYQQSCYVVAFGSQIAKINWCSNLAGS